MNIRIIAIALACSFTVFAHATTAFAGCGKIDIATQVDKAAGTDYYIFATWHDQSDSPS